MDVVEILTPYRVLKSRMPFVSIEPHERGVKLVLNCRVCVKDSRHRVEIAAHSEIYTYYYRWDICHPDLAGEAEGITWRLDFQWASVMCLA